MPIKGMVNDMIIPLKERPRGRMLIRSCMGAWLLLAASAHAATVWTDWTSATIGTLGSATGSAGGVGVSYAGGLDSAVINGLSSPIWTPDSSFTGGTVTASPSVVGDSLVNFSQLPTSTITFGSPVENPVLAIWQFNPSDTGEIGFIVLNAIATLEAGGPGTGQPGGGQPLFVVPNFPQPGQTQIGVFFGDAFNQNGVVELTGTFSSISWTSVLGGPFTFTVGVNGPTNPVPDPMSSHLALVGLGVVGFVSRFRRRSNGL